jgi:hypothetical protein
MAAMPLERRPDGKFKQDKFAGQRTDLVVFVPWEGADAKEWVDKTNQWNQVKEQWNVVKDGKVEKEGKFEIITYDPNVANHPTLVRIGGKPKAAVYIRGHGNPGEEYIQVKMVGTEQTKKLPIIDACQRLIDMGLPVGYAGVIKFYSCHSGTKLIKSALADTRATVASRNQDLAKAVEQKLITQQNADEWKRSAPHDQSMASQGANYMRRQGYTHCTYYGYLGPLGSTYEKDDSDEWHKVVELDGLHDRPKHLKGLTTVRPKMARVRV